MPSEEELQDQQKLLQIYRRRLAHHLEQQAILGAATPFDALEGIRDCREQIQRIKVILRDWNIPAIDQPNDGEIPTAQQAVTSNEVPEEAKPNFGESNGSTTLGPVTSIGADKKPYGIKLVFNPKPDRVSVQNTTPDPIHLEKILVIPASVNDIINTTRRTGNYITKQFEIKDKANHRFWITWPIAVLVSYVIGLLISFVLTTFISFFLYFVLKVYTIGPSLDFLFSILFGITIGATQWLVLRQFLRKSIWWIGLNIVTTQLIGFESHRIETMFVPILVLLVASIISGPILVWLQERANSNR